MGNAEQGRRGGARRKILFAAKTGAHILKKGVGSGLTTEAGAEVEKAKSASALVAGVACQNFQGVRFVFRTELRGGSF